MLSTRLYDTCVECINVQHNVDNISDHDPIFIRMNLSCNRNSSSTRTFKPHLSWVKATTDDLNCYRDNLSSNLKSISIPYSVLLCHDMKCKDCQHYDAINQYLNDITEACLSAGHSNIPYSALLCHDMKCKDCQHYDAINQYLIDITEACLSAGHSNIPYSSSPINSGRIPGWSEEVEPLRQKSLFWHQIWNNCLSTTHWSCGRLYATYKSLLTLCHPPC